MKLQSLKQGLRSSLSNILSVLFPPVCAMCGKPLQTGKYLCDDCLAALPRTQQATLRDNETENLFVSEKNVEKAAAFLFFRKNTDVQRLLHLLKYKEYPELAYVLARQAALEMMSSEFFNSIDVIIPVPLHKRRLFQRGYNQSEWIARGLSDVTKIPMDSEHIVRSVNNSKQALHRAWEREENVAGIFVVNHPEEMYHKHILLVDDIITTGATCRSCIKAMSEFRGAKISVFALGKAK